MAQDHTIIQDFDTYYNEAYTAWNPFLPEAERDLKFYLGDQWSEKEKRQLFQEGRNTFVFNRVRRTINMVTGYQRKNRLSSVVVPVENSDQKTSDQLSQLLLYVMNYGNGYQTISDCFGGALKTGWNLMSLWMDYRDDPVNGDIKFGREPYNGFITDPYLTQLDFSDCAYILRRKYLSPEHVASLIPGQEKEVYSLFRVGWERDDKFTWLPYQRTPNGQELMAYSEMYQQKWRQVPMLVDMETGESMEFDQDNGAIKMLMDKFPQLKVVKRPRRYIELNVIVNDHLLKTEINPYDLDEYPFVPFVSIFEPESSDWSLKVQSLIRCMVDPQREANRRRSQMIDILDSQINSGWIANENSVINPRSLFQSSQGKVIWRREDAPPGALEKIPPAQIPPSMFQLQELFDRDIVDIAGVNDAAFGQTENAGESGVMMMLRQGASIINLQDVMDQLRNSQKQISKKVLKLLQTWRPDKVKRIINEDPTEEFYNAEFTKYDVSVQESVLTDTQRLLYFRQLVELKQLGAPVTGEMLAKAAPIQGKSEYIEELAQNEQAQAQQAQAQSELQNTLIQGQMEHQKASAIEKVAGARERFTRAFANVGLSDERAARAVDDRASAALDRAKAMAELANLDDERLLKYLSIVRAMETNNKKSEEEIKSDDLVVAARGQEVGDIETQQKITESQGPVNPMEQGMAPEQPNPMGPIS